MQLKPLLVVGLLLTLSSTADAQSWLGEPNSLRTGVSFNYARSTEVAETQGEAIEVDVQNTVTSLDVEYVLPYEKLSVAMSLPFTGTSFDPDSVEYNAHNPDLAEWDDGNYHLTPQDVSMAMNYELIGRDYYAIIVSGGFRVPTRDYPIVGIAAPGRGLKALTAGARVVASLDPIIKNVYAAAAYNFAFVEDQDLHPDLEVYNQDRSSVTAAVGYFFTPKLEANLATNLSFSHGGIDFLEFGDVSPVVQDYHDSVLKERAYLVGGGAGYSFTDTLTGNFFARYFVTGANTRNSSIVGLGVDWAITL